VATIAKPRSTTANRRQPTLWKRLKKSYAAYVFVSPAALLITMFSYVAIFFSLYISFHQWDIITNIQNFNGFDNYVRALQDPIVRTSFWNTLYYVVGIVPSITLGALLLAVMANQIQKGRAIFRTIYFIPTITPGVVTAMLWVWVFEPTGVMNRVLALAGIAGPNWLFNRSTAMPAIIIMTLWSAVGYYMIIFMAGLADIPDVFFDAAKVDGANRWQTFWYVTLPLLSNSLIFVVVTLTISAFQMFTQVFIMTRGGPSYATQTVQLTVYQQAFQFLEIGYASAISWLLFVIVFCFAALQLRLFISREVY
jgi:multiple sugar transport system permease protein